MFSPATITPQDKVMVGTLSMHGVGNIIDRMNQGAPASAAWPTANRIWFYPFFISRPYLLSRWWWLNGATVGTDYLQVGIYDQDLNLVRASPRTLSAGTASQVQYVNPGLHCVNVTNGNSTTDQDTYTTASVTLLKDVVYLFAVTNSHASSAPAISSIDSATGGYPTFVSRSTTQFNSNLMRVSIWSAVTSADFTGTLRIQFGASSGVTGCIWSLNALYHVDTASSDGVVQNATGTGSSTTPTSTLSAFGSANNGTFYANGSANSNSGTGEAGTVELTDLNQSTPSLAMQTYWRADNDTTPSGTVTSNPWGTCSVEVKSLGTGAVSLPPMRGYLAMHGNGSTATVFRVASTLVMQPYVYTQTSALSGLPHIAVPASSSVWQVEDFGFTSRSSP